MLVADDEGCGSAAVVAVVGSDGEGCGCSAVAGDAAAAAVGGTAVDSSVGAAVDVLGTGPAAVPVP